MLVDSKSNEAQERVPLPMVILLGLRASMLREG